MSDQLIVQSLFPSNVYFIKKLEFLDTARQVSYEYLKKIKNQKKDSDLAYPLYMTEFMDDPKIYPLIEYINATGFNILHSQGFDVSESFVDCPEFWCQEHEKYSGHNEHVHGFNFQLTGMYFLDVPEDSCELIVYDPRPAKRQINMRESDSQDLSYSTSEIYFKPTAGMLYITNSWLPHGFTRNKNRKPFRFIHFNLSVGKLQKQQQIQSTNTEATII